jgi:hypothetical protein
MYASSNIVRMRCAEHVVQMKGKRNAYKTLVNMNRTDHLRDLNTNGRIILKWIL